MVPPQVFSEGDSIDVDWRFIQPITTDGTPPPQLEVSSDAGVTWRSPVAIVQFGSNGVTCTYAPSISSGDLYRVLTTPTHLDTHGLAFPVPISGTIL